jgi:hypothetical protein
VGVGDEEEEAFRHFDLDVLFDDPEGVLALLDFLVEEVENGDLKGLVQVLELIAKLLILIDVEFIQILDAGDLFADVEDEGEELFGAIKVEYGVPELFEDFGEGLYFLLEVSQVFVGVVVLLPETVVLVVLAVLLLVVCFYVV